MDEKELIEKLNVFFDYLVPKEKIADALKLSRLKEKQRVLVGLFEGHVIRTRIFNHEVYVDVEIGGVINPYQMKDIKPEQSDEA
ncbi:MAG: hypothetical protein M0P91_05340 [Sulfuricurvum sp.]|jgi:hypothetical protein|uniref:hypothetical protein n=1 Tax=Sulfuricurvum sp. TaxID=2025608 RepID=UPI0025DF8E83|nr:hypothetical protein [Sulfuricurvum sp.]MCK9372600.1 hypothetical protein [Sulfuricurvum sp.]